MERGITLAGYRIYRSSSANGTYALVNTGGPVAASQYIDTTAPNGVSRHKTTPSRQFGPGGLDHLLYTLDMSTRNFIEPEPGNVATEPVATAESPTSTVGSARRPWPKTPTLTASSPASTAS